MKRLSLAALLLASLAAAHAQDPGAQQDAEAARQKLLRAADQIEVIQSASDANTAQLATLKAQLDQQRADLETAKAEIASLKGDNAALRASLEKLDAGRAAERKTLLDEVSKIVADGGRGRPAKAEAREAKADASASAPKIDPSQKGYEYVVVKGDTLSSIAGAYQAQGVKTSVAEIRKANGLANGQMLHVGQKLFIPKP